VEKELGLVGFGNPSTGVNVGAAANMLRPITDYSGGWQIKMQLVCAKLVEADILMCEDPTAHMDVNNVKWVKEWLAGFPGSIISTSMNPKFLNEMCTHIIDFTDNKKLRQFKHENKGEVLTKYVEKFPEKAAYFDLKPTKQWVFPEPGVLEGVKSMTRSILTMANVTFQWPSWDKSWPTVSDINLAVCMKSRVGVVGGNGHGKSTAIKLLIGEEKPHDGKVWKTPGLRMAYVAQHAMKHLRDHQDKTPVQYILWRFAGNLDRESIENATKEMDVDEEALRKVQWCVDSKSGVVRKCVVGEKGDVPVIPDTILNRRKNKQKKFEYETKWLYKPIEHSCWVERDTLLAMGYEMIVCREDEKQAAAAGLMSKMLTGPNVEKALMEMGIERETASHTPISSLSDGTAFQVVLTAAMWQNPHILILDEPTNYLDRDGLASLIDGLKGFKGGVVIISHNEEFTEEVSEQKWIMHQGKLRQEGEVEVDAAEEEAFKNKGKGGEGEDEVKDQFGNVIKKDDQKNNVAAMSDKDRKKKIKEIEKKLKEVKKGKLDISEAEQWELQDKLEELKNHA
jgi:elongation factor 3